METIIWKIKIGAPPWQEEIFVVIDEKITASQLDMEKINNHLFETGYKFSRLSYREDNEAPNFANVINI